MANRFLIIGAGLSSCVLAYQLTSELDCSVEICDEINYLMVIVRRKEMQKPILWFINVACIFLIPTKSISGTM